MNTQKKKKEQNTDEKDPYPILLVEMKVAAYSNWFKYSVLLYVEGAFYFRSKKQTNQIKEASIHANSVTFVMHISDCSLINILDQYGSDSNVVVRFPSFW